MPIKILEIAGFEELLPCLLILGERVPSLKSDSNLGQIYSLERLAFCVFRPFFAPTGSQVAINYPLGSAGGKAKVRQRNTEI